LILIDCMLKDFPDSKKALITTLKKASSHLNKIEEMVQADEYCIDIVQQLKAVRGLIHSALDTSLEIHLRSCFKKGMENSSEKTKKKLIDEITTVTRMTNK
jgi:DNA-binding FrmR family transcriptional regulator